MAGFHKNQEQFELFPEVSAQIPKKGFKYQRSASNCTFSLENLVMFGIAIIMVCVFTFSMGVEQGHNDAKTQTHQLPQDSTVVEKNDLVQIQNDVILSDSQVSPKGVLDVIDQPGVAHADEITQNTMEEVIEDREILDVFVESKDDKLEDFYTVQVASFKREENAKREADEIIGLGKDIFVLPKGEHSIVCIGKFSKKAKAKAFSNKVKKKYNDCLVRRF